MGYGKRPSVKLRKAIQRWEERYQYYLWGMAGAAAAVNTVTAIKQPHLILGILPEWVLWFAVCFYFQSILVRAARNANGRRK